MALLVLVAALFAAACSGGGGGSGEQTINGQVTKVDTAAKTFSVNANNKDYDFKMVQISKGDINEIKQHFDGKKPIEVRYRTNSSSPYEVAFAD